MKKPGPKFYTNSNRISIIPIAAAILVLAVTEGCGSPATLISPAALTFTPVESLAAASPQPVMPSPTATVTPTTTQTATPTLLPVSPEPTLTPATVTPSPEEYAALNIIRGLALSDTNHLWAATAGGIVAWTLDTGLTQLFTTADGLANSQANDIVYCPAAIGNWLYVGHEDGMLSILELPELKWRRVRAASNIQTLTCDPAHNRLLAGGTEGIFILDLQSNQWLRVGPEEGLTASTIYEIKVSGPAVWVAAGEQGGYIINGKRAVAFRHLDHYPPGPVNDVATSDGVAWIASPTSFVYFRIQDRSVTPFGSMVPFTSVNRVEIGPDGNIWVANTVEGVCPFNLRARACSTIYGIPEGLQLTELILSSDGTAFAGTDGDGIVILLPDGVRRLIYSR